jgi:hypothetical protein
MPPRGVKSPKGKRQYEHIKESALKRGRSTRRAKEIAAATVNKQRRKAGQTKTSRKSSSRKSSSGPLLVGEPIGRQEERAAEIEQQKEVGRWNSTPAERLIGGATCYSVRNRDVQTCHGRTCHGRTYPVRTCHVRTYDVRTCHVHFLIITPR